MSTTGTAPVAHVVRRRLVVRGLVQGVGFRPHVARLAADLGLVGDCRNDETGVVAELEGPAPAVAEFERRLVDQAPPLASIRSVHGTDLPPAGGTGFAITPSTPGAGERTMVPPDTAPCADCLAELADPADRRHRHPFLTCTHCGPRLTITLDLPYDRAQTTMAGFPMCPTCATEYADARDRRYHAQPVACHDCGPRLAACAPDGGRLADPADTEACLAVAIEALRAGRIVAVKGLGGYHLCCDAADPEAVAELRVRKHRPDQPFALMARDLATAERLVEVGGAAALLTSPERPIVLLPARPSAAVAGAVAPRLGELGVMLPYTPLHQLLFAQRPDGSPGAPPVLVMTSGNASGEPLCFTDHDALARLGGIADLFLTHDRPIAVPVEDSVIAWSERTGAVPIRRSRGYAPLPVDLPAAPPGAAEPVVLAAGAELKNTVALVRGGRAFVSAHVGDLESLASRTAHQRVTDQLLGFHRSEPDLLVADLHPGYASRAWAERFAAETDTPLLEVQHHHAHLASLAAEHGRLDEPVLGLVFDGTGYGCDATVWGGELLLLGDGGRAAARLGRLGSVRLPGADAGVRHPVRTAAIALLDAGVPLTGTAVGAELSAAEEAFLTRSHVSGEGLVDTSSVGRLFDVVASLLGLRHRITYEAQAAVELEAAARTWRRTTSAAAADLPLPVVGADPSRLDPAPLVRALDAAVRDGVPAGALASAFHESLARASAEWAAAAAADHGLRTVGLSGGVFVNRLLLSATADRLTERGLEVLTHRRVPANDGGLALGQAALGHRHLTRSHAR